MIFKENADHTKTWVIFGSEYNSFKLFYNFFELEDFSEIVPDEKGIKKWLTVTVLELEGNSYLQSHLELA